MKTLISDEWEEGLVNWVLALPDRQDLQIWHIAAQLCLISGYVLSMKQAKNWVTKIFKRRYGTLYPSKLMLKPMKAYLQFQIIYSANERKQLNLPQHPLRSLETKALVQEDFASSLKFVKKQIQVLLSREQLYFIKGLNMIPHLDSPLAEKAISDALLDEAGFERIEIDCSEPHFHNDYISVYRFGSQLICNVDVLFSDHYKTLLDKKF
jgi:hypothetical protein